MPKDDTTTRTTTRKKASPWGAVSREECLLLPGNAVKVLVALRLHTPKSKSTRQDDWLTVKLTIATLIEDTHLSERTVRRALDWLEANLYLRKERASKGQSFLFMFTRGSTSNGQPSPVRMTGPLLPPKDQKSGQNGRKSPVKMAAPHGQNDRPAGIHTPSELSDSETESVSPSVDPRRECPPAAAADPSGGLPAAAVEKLPSNSSGQETQQSPTNHGSSPPGEGRVGMGPQEKLEIRRERIYDHLIRVFHIEEFAAGPWVNGIKVQPGFGSAYTIPVGLIAGTVEDGILTVGKNHHMKIPLSKAIKDLDDWDTDNWPAVLVAMYQERQRVKNPAGFFRKMVIDVVDESRPKDLKLTKWAIKPLVAIKP